MAKTVVLDGLSNISFVLRNEGTAAAPVIRVEGWADVTASGEKVKNVVDVLTLTPAQQTTAKNIWNVLKGLLEDRELTNGG